MVAKSVFLGKYSLSKPLEVSLFPLFQENRHPQSKNLYQDLLKSLLEKVDRTAGWLRKDLVLYNTFYFTIGLNTYLVKSFGIFVFHINNETILKSTNY